MTYDELFKAVMERAYEVEGTPPIPKSYKKSTNPSNQILT